MRCFAKYALPVAIASGALVALGLDQRTAAAEDPAALQADHEFLRAAAKGDKEAVGKLLDADFTWTDAQGKTYTKSEASTELPQLDVRDDSDAKVEHRDYGQVVAVMTGRGKAYALRVWVKRPAGWRGAGLGLCGDRTVLYIFVAALRFGAGAGGLRHALSALRL